MTTLHRLSGKTAVITGGATGIGFATAKRFIEEGAFVYIFGRRQEKLDAAVSALGPNARAIKGSVTNPADLEKLYDAVKSERGRLDIVMANAGAGVPAPLGKITGENCDVTFDTNLKGTIYTVQGAVPLMAGGSGTTAGGSGGGSIILTGSSAGERGAPMLSLYAASKAAIRNLARSWAGALQAQGIRINVLSPASIGTEIAKEALGEKGMMMWANRNPLKRVGEPTEIAAVAAFLASSDSSFMTASVVAVDGGLAQL